MSASRSVSELVLSEISVDKPEEMVAILAACPTRVVLIPVSVVSRIESASVME